MCKAYAAVIIEARSAILSSVNICAKTYDCGSCRYCQLYDRGTLLVLAVPLPFHLNIRGRSDEQPNTFESNLLCVFYVPFP